MEFSPSCSRWHHHRFLSESLGTGVEDNAHIGDKIPIRNNHIRTHSESIILAQPFQRDGDGPVHDDENAQTTTFHQECPDDHDDCLDRPVHEDFGFLDDFLPADDYNSDYLFETNSSPPVRISISRTATARSTSPDAR